MKKKNWPKRPKAVPQKSKFGQKYKWFKNSSLEFFFRKYYFGHAIFLCSFKRASGHHQSFFLISDLLAESLKAKKDHSFYNTVLLRKPHSFDEPQIFQETHLHCTIFWSLRTTFLSVCFCISPQENFCSRDAVRFYLVRMGRGEIE